MNESERRLLLAIARYLTNDGEHAPSVFDVEAALAAAEAPATYIARCHSCGHSIHGSARCDVLIAANDRCRCRMPGENANENAKSPARDTTGGAGGGDPLPQPSDVVLTKLLLSARLSQAESDAIRDRESRLARLSLVHQRTEAEVMRLVKEWRIWAGKRHKQAMDYPDPQCAQMLHEASLHVIRADELEKALALAASTTETPP